MNRRLLPLALMAVGVLVPWVPVLRAAVEIRDLGKGLAYYRAHRLPEDLPLTPPTPGACVLDLRFAQSDASAPAALAAWLKFHAAVRTPVFVLANTETAPELLAPIVGKDIAGIVIIGPVTPHFHPDIGLRLSEKDDLRAYEALDRGTTLDSLLADQPDKPRMDEEKLEREHLSDSLMPDDAGGGTEAKESASASKPHLTDPVLQRAVHLHRALLALNRI